MAAPALIALLAKVMKLESEIVTAGEKARVDAVGVKLTKTPSIFRCELDVMFSE